MNPRLKVSAETFSVTPTVGAPTSGRLGAVLEAVYGDLKSTVVLLDDNFTQLCIVTSPAPMEGAELRGAVLHVLSETLGLMPEQIITNCSHDHCIPNFVDNATYGWAKVPGIVTPGTLNDLGRAFLAGLRIAASRLAARLVPVSIAWGKASETRVTFNRRGRRPDGRSYFIREEDRLLLDPTYIGEIDPDAVVVLFRNVRDEVVAALAFYTGHPLTAYNPEKMISFGEWPQVACERLSAKLGGAPVAFLQGCAGNINSKYMLGGTVAQSRELGGYLGDTFYQAAAASRPSIRSDLRRCTATAQVPFSPLPDEAALRKDLAEIDEFIRRGQSGDATALECVGMNFPKALTPPYRARLVEMIRPWFLWALQVHHDGLAGEVPKFLPVDITVARIGDIGVVGLPFEAFVQTGLKIKREAPLPCVLPCAYTNGAHGYIPDASAYADREYMAGFFRYTKNRPPYASPAGDAVAELAVKVLADISQ